MNGRGGWGRAVRIAIIAGESSGDLLGAGLLRAIKDRRSKLSIEGIGGPLMQAQGCVSHYPMERLSVIGLFEAFGRYPELLPVRARLARRFLADPPDVFIGVDAPDFNLEIARRLRRAGIRTVHYVSPSVWAWRRYRLRKIARSVDLMLALFPFEVEFYRANQLPVQFVGHPLADLIPERVDRGAARDALAEAREGEIVALLPGSRVSEVASLAEPMVMTARWLAKRRPGVRFLAPLVNRATHELFRAVLERAGADANIRMLEGCSREAMAAADAILLASGTDALEAMLIKRPMVITYKTTALSFAILRFWVGSNVPHIGLPNLLAGRALVPEMLQGRATPEHLGPPLLGYLEQPEDSREMLREFVRLHGSLRRSTNETAAQAVIDLAEGRRHAQPC